MCFSTAQAICRAPDLLHAHHTPHLVLVRVRTKVRSGIQNVGYHSLRQQLTRYAGYLAADLTLMNVLPSKMKHLSTHLRIALLRSGCISAGMGCFSSPGVIPLPTTHRTKREPLLVYLAHVKTAASVDAHSSRLDLSRTICSPTFLHLSSVKSPILLCPYLPASVSSWSKPLSRYINMWCRMVRQNRHASANKIDTSGPHNHKQYAIHVLVCTANRNTPLAQIPPLRCDP